jgi:hypothetical protein
MGHRINVGNVVTKRKAFVNQTEPFSLHPRNVVCAFQYFYVRIEAVLSIHGTKACLILKLLNFCEVLGFRNSVAEISCFRYMTPHHWVMNGSSNFPYSALVSKMSRAQWRGVVSQKNGYLFSILAILVIYRKLPNFPNVITSDFYSGGDQFENNLGRRIIWTRFPCISQSLQETVRIVSELWLLPSRSFPIQYSLITPPSDDNKLRC